MRLTASLLSLVAILLLSVANAAYAAPFVGGTNAWTMVDAPAEQAVGEQGLLVTYHNNLDVPTQGIVIMVVRNAVGQTLYYSTATISPKASSSAMAFLVEFGLPPGEYNASVFAFTFGGVAISNLTTGAFSF